MIATVVLFLSLGLDTVAVALGLGLSGLPQARWWRVGLTFAAFEGLMPVAGLLLGRQFDAVLGAAATYAAALLLVAIGLLAIKEALSDDGSASLADVGDARKLLLTGLSVSLDELAVGFSLGVLGAPLGPALGYIAIQAFALTMLGLRLGRGLGQRLGERAELASGVVLSLLGAALIISEATGSHFL